MEPLPFPLFMVWPQASRALTHPTTLPLQFLNNTWLNLLSFTIHSLRSLLPISISSSSQTIFLHQITISMIKTFPYLAQGNKSWKLNHLPCLLLSISHSLPLSVSLSSVSLSLSLSLTFSLLLSFFSNCCTKRLEGEAAHLFFSSSLIQFQLLC